MVSFGHSWQRVTQLREFTSGSALCAHGTKDLKLKELPMGIKCPGCLDENCSDQDGKLEVRGDGCLQTPYNLPISFPRQITSRFGSFGLSLKVIFEGIRPSRDLAGGPLGVTVFLGVPCSAEHVRTPTARRRGEGEPTNVHRCRPTPNTALPRLIRGLRRSVRRTGPRASTCKAPSNSLSSQHVAGEGGPETPVDSPSRTATTINMLLLARGMVCNVDSQELTDEGGEGLSIREEGGPTDCPSCSLPYH